MVTVVPNPFQVLDAVFGVDRVVAGNQGKGLGHGGARVRPGLPQSELGRGLFDQGPVGVGNVAVGRAVFLSTKRQAEKVTAKVEQ